jgi:hypothetical protein
MRSYPIRILWCVGIVLLLVSCGGGGAGQGTGGTSSTPSVPSPAPSVPSPVTTRTKFLYSSNTVPNTVGTGNIAAFAVDPSSCL